MVILRKRNCPIRKTFIWKKLDFKTYGWMPRLESLKVRLLWNIVLPVVTKWKGYSPWAMLQIGEDLPLGVYKQWRHWCTFPHYFFDNPDTPYMAEKFSQMPPHRCSQRAVRFLGTSAIAGRLHRKI